jgi:hypothetical protein
MKHFVALGGSVDHIRGFFERIVPFMRILADFFVFFGFFRLFFTLSSPFSRFFSCFLQFSLWRAGNVEI